jgi:hypothetical protein
MSLEETHGAVFDESTSALVAGGNERDTNCLRARLAWPVKVFARPQRRGMPQLSKTIALLWWYFEGLE